jgi:undecaprenyl-diphosphatase
MAVGLNKKDSTEFSFFLAVPTLAGASAVKSIEAFSQFDMQFLNFCLVGMLISFVVAVLAIKFFINILNQFGLKPFGYYRILIGGLLWALLWTGQI